MKMPKKARRLCGCGFAVWVRTVVRGFLDNNCSMHAAGLTYFSMLALVPVLCVLLTVAKACGADDLAKRQISAQVDAWIEHVEKGQDDQVATALAKSEEEIAKKKAAAEALASQARSIRDGLFERIDQFNVGTLGWIGFVMLLWTVVSSIGMVEVSFNEIWGVAKARPIWKRAALYLSIVVVLPIFAALAMSVPILNVVKNVIVATLGATELTHWASDGLIWFLDSWILRSLITLFFSSVAFGFIFAVMPNRPVRRRHAWWGGIITAVAFGAWMKVCAVAQVGIAKSSALYGSFAFLPIVLAWLYMSWQIVLLGANMVRAFEKCR